MTKFVTPVNEALEFASRKQGELGTQYEDHCQHSS